MAGRPERNLPPAVNRVGGTGWSIARVGDFDGDGRNDILWRNGSSNVVWYMLGGSVINSEFLPSVGPTWSPVAVGDYNGNAVDDIIWYDSASGVVAMWSLTGMGVPPAVTTLGVVASGWTVVGDD